MEKDRFKMPVAAHLFLMRGNEILLMLRKNSSFDGMYGVPAGHLDGGEGVASAMIREAKEEIGIDIEKEDLRLATVSHSNANDKEYIQFFFFCDKWNGELKNMEPEKCGGIDFFPINDLPTNIVPYIKRSIECALNKEAYFEFGW